MRTLVVLQSRLTSTRLPGKALLTLAGRPAVVLAAQRASNTGLEVVVATSERPQDDAVASELARAGIRCFRGSLDDPLARFVAATADLSDTDIVVRLTADNVVPDGALLEELVAALGAEGYVRTAAGLPYGLSGEAFSVAMLRAADAETSTAPDREHVTPWIRRHTAEIEFTPEALSALDPADPRAHLRCTIDTLDDYVVAHRALAGVDDAVAVPWSQLLDAWVGAGGSSSAPVPPAAPNVIGQGGWVLGTVQLGLDYGAANQGGLPSEDEAGSLLSAAASAGVTHFDTARAYGLSESRIGRSLARGLSERVGVITKVRPLDDVDAVSPEHVRLAAAHSVERSLRELSTSSVEALLVHRWSDWIRAGGAVASLLAELQSEGVARLVGVSLSTPEELLGALADERVGYVQLPFNLLDRRWTDLHVQAALQERPDVVVTARSVFLQGLLAAPREAAWPHNSGVDPAALIDALEHVAQELDRVSTADLSLAYVRGHRFVTSVVLGADTARQVHSQAALFHSPPLTSEEIALVEERVRPGSATLVDPSQWRMSP